MGKRPRAPTRPSRRSSAASGIGIGSSSSSGGGGGLSGGGGGASVTALADVGNALLSSFLLPLGPLLIDRRLNAGYFRESDTPVWWALALLSFSGGQWLACSLRARASSWHLYMNRPPRQRAARVQLTALLGLVASVASTGMVTRLGPLFLARFATGFWAVFLWGHARERAAKGAAAANAGLAAAGRWSNNRILPQHHGGQHQQPGQQALGEEGPLVNPMAALGVILGGLIGGLAFPTRTFALVGGRPALLVSLLAALCALLLGCLVLRRLNKELAALGSKNSKGGGPAYSRLSHEDLDASASTSTSFTRKDAATGAAAPVVIEMGSLSSTTTTPAAGAAAAASGDSSHAPPPTFLKACGGNEAKARAKWAATLAWRQREGVDRVLERPQPNFAAIKEHYPHYVHGRSKRGEIVVYEFPGRMDLGKLKSMGVGAAEIGRHYTFFQEFMFRRLTQGDEGRVMTVLDIGGLGLGTLSKDVLDVLRTTSEIMNNHYPERVTRICVVNAPFFAGAAWRVLQAVLPQSVQDKIELTADPGPGLRKYIDAAAIPGCYQGASPLPLGESEEERLLREIVAQANAGTAPAAATPVVPALPPPSAAAASAPATPATPKTPTTPSASTGGSGWLPALFSGRGSGGKGKGPQQAHLGYENRFIFDQQRKIWVLEEERPPLQPHTTPLAKPTVTPLVALASPSPSSSTVVSSPFHTPPLSSSKRQGPSAAAVEADSSEDEREEEQEGTPEKGGGDEEDGLIRAIQAAHYAERLAREGRAHPSSLLLVGAEEGVAGLAGKVPSSESAFGVDAVDDGGGAGGADGGASLTMLLQMALVYSLWAGLEGVVHAVLPVWMVAPHHLGGLGVKARSVGVMLALGAGACLALHTHGPHPLLRLPWASPLRAFRLAVALIVLASLGLAAHPRVAPDRGATPSGATRFSAWLLHATLLTALVAALAVGRVAAGVLLDMAARAHQLQQQQQQQQQQRRGGGGGGGKGSGTAGGGALAVVAASLSACSGGRDLRRIREWAGQVVGPWVAAALLSYGMQAGLHFPSDARLPLNFVALGSVGLYLLTIQLRMSVSGDFGHLSLDAAEAHSHNQFRFQHHRSRRR